jgi:predicted transcriptional regulator
MLSALLVRDAMSSAGAVLDSAAPVGNSGQAAQETGVVVVNGKAEVVGVITKERLDELLRSGEAAVAAESAMASPVTLAPDDTLDAALGKLVESGMSWLPVVERGRLVGRVTVRGILHTYKSTLQRSVRRAATLPHDTSLFEARLVASSSLVGRTLADAGLPPDVLVVSITRDGETLFPRASTRIEADDVLMITTHRTKEAAVRVFLEGGPSAPS